jgi:hypothetical protein
LVPLSAVMTSVTRIRLKSKAIPKEINLGEGMAMVAAFRQRI